MVREVSPPTKVWVGTYEFTLDFLPPDHPSLMVRGKTNDGCTDVEEQEIAVAAHLDDRKMLEIVWHELTHAINWVYDITDGAREETIARKHGVAWSTFWMDNPHYVRWYQYVANKIKRARLAHPVA